jgi:glutaredoxin
MKQLFLLVIIFFLSVTGYAQNEHKFVKLKEVKKGKRVSLYAENTDSISYDVFLKVETKDYRRSSNRPIIRTIAPKTKVKLLTLIQLTNTKGKYHSMFVVNEVAYALEVDKNNDHLSFKLDKAIKDKKVILYTKDDCLICPDVKRILDNNKIGFTEYNIDKDSTNYLKIIKEFQNDKENRRKNRIPMLKVENQVFNTIKSLDDFVVALRQAFN